MSLPQKSFEARLNICVGLHVIMTSIYLAEGHALAKSAMVSTLYVFSIVLQQQEA